MWKYGRKASVTSPGRMPTTAAVCSTFATRFRCVSNTPLGSPVVPEEYGITTTLRAGSTGTCAGIRSPSIASSGNAPSAAPITAISRTPVPAAPACAAGRSAGAVTRSSAPASRSWWPTSSAVEDGLSVVAVPPAQATA